MKKGFGISTCLDATHSGLGELEIWIRVVAAASTTTTTDSLLNRAAKEKLPTRAGERAQLQRL